MASAISLVEYGPEDYFRVYMHRDGDWKQYAPTPDV
jgi:hypothetical protein